MSVHEFVIEATVFVDGNATVANIDLVDTNNIALPINVTGSAKRGPGDKHDEAISVNLAMGRALGKLGRKLERRANGLVKQADNVAAAKAARKASDFLV